MVAWIRGLPGFLGFLIWLLIALIVIIVLAWILHAVGGFDWHFSIGFFHWDLGVSKRG